MLTTLGSGPVIDGTGLFHVIGSYCGEFSITATCCRAMMPDPEFYVKCLHESFNDLKEAAIKKNKPATKAKKVVTKAKAKAKAKAKPKAKTKSAVKPKAKAKSVVKPKAKPKAKAKTKAKAKGSK